MMSEHAVEDAPTRHRVRSFLRISVATLMILVAVLAIWLAQVTNRARNQAAVLAELERRGCRVTFDYQYPEGASIATRIRLAKAQPPGPAWLRRVVGDEYFRKVVVIEWSWWPPVHPPQKFAADYNGPRPDDDFFCKLASLRGLRSLSLSSLEISDQAFTRAPGFRSLTLLTVSGCKNLGGEFYAHLATMPKLRILNCRDCPIDDAGFAHVAALPQLETLLVDGRELSDEGLAPLARLVHLKGLVLMRTTLGDPGLAHLRALKELTSLTIESQAVIDFYEAKKASSEGKNLRQMYEPRITDLGLAHVATLTHLQKLDLSRCQITSEGLASIGKLEQLEQLRLIGLGRSLTDESLRPLAGLTRLQSLALKLDGSSSTHLSGEAFAHLVESLPALRALSLAPRYTALKAIRQLPASHPRLRLFNVD